MAILDLPRQMAALEAVREELETALGDDENWRALHPTGGSRGDADADRRDRDARLVKALEANPLYLAWTNVCEAIDALRDADAAPEAALTAIELPEDIRARIRADADGDAAIGEDAREQSGTLGGKLATIPSLDPGKGPAKWWPSPGRRRQRTTRAVANGDIGKRCSPGRSPRRPAAPSHDRARRGQGHLRPAPDAGSSCEGAGRHRCETAPSGDAFVPATAAAEEAEVAIVNAPVRRFLKALSGD